MMEIAWRLLAFDDLQTNELYELLRLRAEVFVVEQACAFQDLDGLDASALHLLGFRGAQLALYARLLPAGSKYAEASIGRVITHASLRGSGYGHTVMRQAIALLTDRWGQQAIRIGAQQRLAAFYEQHGFAAASLPYDEDGIAHIEMLNPQQTHAADSSPQFSRSST
jgi:ElaA protein